ncbi:uncharacterized protein LOC118418552 [Branchiostoma floridae]|uniref:Uncharacterized protein LOC118418552 n=1 Tax=Branchiostoma floridae TaxID=7739 RepID=A0A9J7LE63_BRAFL|nr:uncharacterized protein LOC118418552 [Branchiostoma floridae]
MVKSHAFTTGQHEFQVFVLPSDRDTRHNLGLFLKLSSGHPTVVNVRFKITYGTFYNNLEGKMNFRAGEVKGWSDAVQAEVLDQADVHANLELNIVIQHYLS